MPYGPVVAGVTFTIWPEVSVPMLLDSVTCETPVAAKLLGSTDGSAAAAIGVGLNCFLSTGGRQ